MKKIFVTPLFFIFLAPIAALELTDIQGSLGDVFSSTIDDNEGLTSFRSLNIPSGGRTEALGTAFTGLSDDITFFDYNPAASAILEETQIAVFHNAWISDSALETLSATQRTGNLGYGFQLKCFYVPFTEYNLYGERVTGSYYSETAATFNVAYNFLAGYNFKGLAVGANARAAWRNIPDYTDNQTDAIISGSGLEQSALGLMADVGMLMQFNALKFYHDRKANLTVGLALTNVGTALTCFGNSVTTDDPLPTRIAAGLSYRPFSRIIFTSEVRKPLNLTDFSKSGAFSFASGIETQITRFFAFQLGFLLQGANPRISMGSEFELKKIKMDVTYTFDLTSSANPVNHISLSAKMLLGDRGRKALIEKVDQCYLDGLKFYAEGYYDEAILKWNEAIVTAASDPLNMRFEPAEQAKRAAVNFNRNKFDLESMYSVSFDEE